MDDHDLVTHGLHWLTMTAMGWECVHPDCDWHIGPVTTLTAQRIFDADHAKLSEAPASVPS